MIERRKIYRLFFDGTVRKNPGPAAYGYLIKDKNKTIFRESGYIGETTSNVAEYIALIEGLRGALNLGIRRLAVYGDSQLVINQVTGTYSVSAGHLKTHCHTARGLISKFETINLFHVPREENLEADKLARNVLFRMFGPVRAKDPISTKQIRYIRKLMVGLKKEDILEILKRLDIKIVSSRELDRLNRREASRLIDALSTHRAERN